jgi:2Fe-2S ferredoxin
MIIRLNVVDRNDNEHVLEVPASGSLMEALREPEYGVPAICGGMCSCATCHVYVAPEWAGRLDAQQSDERDLMTGLEHHRETSRLSCQIRLSGELDGLRLTLAPEE